MTIIKCPFCEESISINISNAIDENGEAYICPKCKNVFRFTEK